MLATLSQTEHYATRLTLGRAEGRREESGLDCGPGGLCLRLRTEKLLKIERRREIFDVCVDV